MRSLIVLVAVVSALGCSKKSRDDSRVPDPKLGRADGGTSTSPRPSSGPLAECQGDRPAGNGDASSVGDCKTDADCTTGKNGRCHHARGGGPRMPHNYCTYDGCFADDDCAASQLCYCNRQNGNFCLAANCRTDADCGGAKCPTSPSLGCGGGRGGDFCRTPRDKCKTDADCPVAESRAACVFIEAEGVWGCRNYPECPVG